MHKIVLDHFIISSFSSEEKRKDLGKQMTPKYDRGFCKWESESRERKGGRGQEESGREKERIGLRKRGR